MKNLRKKSRPSKDLKQESKVILFTEKALKEVENYFFKKAALEVRKFAKPSQIENILTEELMEFCNTVSEFYQISAVCEMAAAIKDFASTTFWVPVIYKHSPLACSIINESHCYSKIAKHLGVETIWRYILKVWFVSL